MGRKLSSVDLLSPSADPFVDRANQQILDKHITQENIRADLNQSLSELGLETISRAAFNRHALKVVRGEYAAPNSIESIIRRIVQEEIQLAFERPTRFYRKGVRPVARITNTDIEGLGERLFSGKGHS